ncbi:RagB/SusD family nutrient uptake outer membrane protein [Niabella pedocola]|uniref:RagB/SusD family nutrient uptake outer membrane protein n=1 Tax=Niabella pedocola TaxID=1752077 RepID=A0ABS8PMX8_9BACT|nr:RagB/SusD family nutrient uptake outer membrane protein [Niabella pedocola]MCD2422456.1 RagB/SusD family nutrient uptake outer membrane protein [Niabella pedocola]
MISVIYELFLTNSGTAKVEKEQLGFHDCKSVCFSTKRWSAVLVLFLTFLGTGCGKFLDVVPNDTPTLEHAFSNRSVTEKFLRTCYSWLPDPTDPLYYPAYFTSRDEFDYKGESRAGNSLAGQISRGLQNTNTPYQDYWSGYADSRNSAVKSMYKALRDCNIFLENANKPRDITEEERTRWISEVKFLKAYYHFFLLELYGPIVLAKENIPVSATPEETWVYREPVDECVDYIAGLIDEAMPGLPPVLPDPTTEQGRISQVIALGVKAKLLATAASPLFNGNPDYAGWTDKRGKQLIPATYDPAKWQRAATAIKEAIDAAENNGFRLYEFNKFSGGAKTFAMNDSMVQLMTIRKSITESLERNPGVIWATQEQFADGKGNSAGLGLNSLGNMLKLLYPQMYSQDQSYQAQYYAASWHMAELFYSNNGVPIEDDKFFDYANRYKPRRAIASDHHTTYIPTGEITASMHFFREPRFYADLGFDRGYFENETTTDNGGATFAVYLRQRSGETGLNGYVPKKIIAFESSSSKGVTGNPYAPYPYQFPLLRLADLYLLYSEALNEVKGAPDAEVYQWIDKVRANAGLNGVVQSWQAAAYNPAAPTNKNEMRKIIQRERLIELAFEGQRFWDIRRWKTALQYWSLPPTLWTTTGATPDAYYVPFVYGAPRTVSFRDYLYPISQVDIRANTNLVQTYGW